MKLAAPGKMSYEAFVVPFHVAELAYASLALRPVNIEMVTLDMLIEPITIPFGSAMRTLEHIVSFLEFSPV